MHLTLTLVVVLTLSLTPFLLPVLPVTSTLRRILMFPPNRCLYA